jgi:hypothetical protein
VSLEAIKARNEREKAAGVVHLHPEHAGGPRPKATARAALPVLAPCAHEGAVLEFCPTCRGGEGRHVRDCSHPDNPTERCTREYVSAAAWSCDRCPHRAPAAVSVATKNTPALVKVPLPLSPLELAAPPASPRAVATVVTGEPARALHALSRPYHEAYAKRIGADYVVLTQPPPDPAFPLSAKFRLGQLLGHYERVCFLDADAVPLAGAPDLFAEARADEFGFHDDLPGLTRVGALSLVGEYHELRRVAGLAPGECRFIANTGVLVFAREHREILEPPGVPIPLRHCAEQNWTTARLHDAAARLRRLPSNCNYQYWAEGQFQNMRRGLPVILHFSGIVPHKSNAERLAVMRAVLRAS